MTPNDVFELHVPQATIALFDAYGVPATLRPSRGQEYTPGDIVGTIGFVAPGLKGALNWIGTRAVAASMGQSTSEEASIRDWVGEIANQLLGRVKNLLLPYGPVLHMSTPVVIAGSELSIPARRDAAPLRYVFETPSGTMGVVVHYTANPEFDLHEPIRDDSSPNAEEGDALLF